VTAVVAFSQQSAGVSMQRLSVLHTSAITSDLGNTHVTSVLQPHHYSTDRLPELTSLTARYVAPLLPSGTL